MNSQAAEALTTVRQFLLAEKEMRRRVLQPPRRDKAIAEADEALRALSLLAAHLETGAQRGEFFSLDEIKAAGDKTQTAAAPEMAMQNLEARFPGERSEFDRLLSWHAGWVVGRLVARLQASRRASAPPPRQADLFGGGV